VNYIVRFYILFVICCTGLTQIASGQDTTRYIKPSTRLITEQEIDRNQDWHSIDTSLNRFEIFQPVYKKYIMFQDLGNIGSPSRPLLFDINQRIGFQYAQNPFQVYFIDPYRSTYVNSKTPYSDLFYAQGKQNLIFLQVKYSQNILPRWNVGIDYQRITSAGFSPRQYTSLYNYQFYTSFQSKNKRYTLLANITANRGLVEESGGISSDSAYESLSGSQKVVNPKLSDAETKFRNRSAHIKQYWNIGKPIYKYTENDTLYDFEQHSHISYTFHAEENSYIFSNKNTDSTIFPNQYYDVPGPTYDSAYFRKIENKVSIDLFNTREKQSSDSVRNYLGAGILHQIIAVSQIPFVRGYQNVILDGTFERIDLKDYRFSLAANGAYALSGYNAFDFKIDGFVRYRFPGFDITANLLTQLYEPDFAFQLFKSNQFIWNNNFDKIKVLKPGITLTTRKWRNNATLSLNTYTINNWVYAGTDGTPKQDNGTFSVQTITLSKTFQAWKFHFEHDLLYQRSFSDNVRMPEFGGMARYYFSSYLFKKLKFQLGFSVFYNTAYYGNNYNPATRFFYLQNDTRIGNYPVIDPFFAGVIKTASFFVKYEHVNQDWINSGYYYTPHYPVTLRSLRIGIRWRFYN
jgi:hypothetical protein